MEKRFNLCIKFLILLILADFNVQEILDVLREVSFTSAGWRELGRRLKDDMDFDAIESNYSTCERRLEAVITDWSNNDDAAGWHTLSIAIAKCRRGGGKNVARKLCEKVGIQFP